jgi:hypothetical protein
VAAPTVKVPETSKPLAEIFPFKTQYKEGTHDWQVAYIEWENLLLFLAGASAPVVEPQKVDPTKVEPTTRMTKTVAAVAAAMQETTPVMEPIPTFDKIFVLADGFHFYPDLTEAVPPLPLNVTFHRAVNPPGYEPGSKKIARGMKFDWMNYCWFQE